MINEQRLKNPATELIGQARLKIPGIVRIGQERLKRKNGVMECLNKILDKSKAII